MHERSFYGLQTSYDSNTGAEIMKFQQFSGIERQIGRFQAKVHVAAFIKQTASFGFNYGSSYTRPTEAQTLLQLSATHSLKNGTTEGLEKVLQLIQSIPSSRFTVRT